MGPFLYVQLPEADFMGIDRVLPGIVFCDGNFMVICWELMGISWDFTVSIAGIKRHKTQSILNCVFIVTHDGSMVVY